MLQIRIPKRNPFAALRVISDPATRALPVLAMAAIKPNGGIDLRKVLRAIARNPLTVLDLDAAAFP